MQSNAETETHASEKQNAKSLIVV